MSRTGPKSPEHREKIRQALRRYNANGGHLSEYQKSGEEHPNWKGGVKPDVYRRRAFDAYGKACMRCGTIEEHDNDIHVHHRDRNRRNGAVENLEVLCRTCHMQEHHRIRVEWTCPQCESVKMLQPFDAQRRKYCSNACRLAARLSDGRFRKA